MPQATQHTEPATGLIPTPRTALDDAPPAWAGTTRPKSLGAVLQRGFSVARGVFSLRPVAARPQPGYGEVDGQ
ncbi:hypothetical protein AB0K51_25915 [Kitasatospora sp. NPDC049285]|uniref:hypothetical protein n=1 Tax=Kitasatospora sp. NPDC049285 TaxID=3157096 RepID=UPI00341AD1F6